MIEVKHEFHMQLKDEKVKKKQQKNVKTKDLMKWAEKSNMFIVGPNKVF